MQNKGLDNEASENNTRTYKLTVLCGNLSMRLTLCRSSPWKNASMAGLWFPKASTCINTWEVKTNQVKCPQVGTKKDRAMGTYRARSLSDLSLTEREYERHWHV